MNTHFQGKAKIYEKYRPKLPQILFDFLERQLNLSSIHKKENLLDLGCGTGQLTLPLSKYFTKITAVDPSEDMLHEAKIILEKSDCLNIELINSRAEDLAESMGIFDFITLANSFHWMDHAIVVPWMMKHLKNDGFLILIGSYQSFFTVNSDWKKELSKIIEKWFGREKKKISNSKPDYKLDWKDELIQYSFPSVENYKISENRVWSIENLIGFLSSVSFITQKISQDKMAKFEHEIKEKLLTICPNDQFKEQHEINIIIARK